MSAKRKVCVFYSWKNQVCKLQQCVNYNGVFYSWKLPYFSSNNEQRCVNYNVDLSNSSSRKHNNEYLWLYRYTQAQKHTKLARIVLYLFEVLGRFREKSRNVFGFFGTSQKSRKVPILTENFKFEFSSKAEKFSAIEKH